MRIATLIGVCAVLFASLTSDARVITVDCNGGADYTDLLVALQHTVSGDTVMVAPCVYPVTAALGWPKVLGPPARTLTIIGAAGDESTILEGDRTASVFRVREDALTDLHLHGLTFRNVVEVIDLEYLYGLGRLVFTDNTVEDCARGLDASELGTNSLIARSVIRNNGGWSGIEIEHFFGLIEDNEICYNQSGIHGVCCETPTIRGNYIHDNLEDGIVPGFFLNADHNIIEDNGGRGLYLPGASGSITHNIIRGNAVGIEASGRREVTLRYNDICANTIYNVLGHPSNSWILDATLNWWGTVDADQIAAQILDCHDDPGIGCCVTFDPWCVGPGCQATLIRPSSWGSIKAMFRP